MGVIGASGLIYRDFLQYILPTIIGVSLFAPLVAPPGVSLDLEILLFLAFILGYLLFTPVTGLAEWVQDWLPIHRQELYLARAERAWWAVNWNYDELWSVMDKDEREYLYATASYIYFYRLVTLYLVIYALANIYLVIRGCIQFDPGIAGSQFMCVGSIHTPMLGNWQANTWMVTIAAAVLGYYQYRNALDEYKILFGTGGFHVKFSEKYQHKAGGIASAVWGWIVKADRSPLERAKILLLKHDGSQIAETDSGKKGEFQFIDAFDQCVGIKCIVRIDHPAWTGETEIHLTEKSVPRIRLEASPRPVV